MRAVTLLSCTNYVFSRTKLQYHSVFSLSSGNFDFFAKTVPVLPVSELSYTPAEDPQKDRPRLKRNSLPEPPDPIRALTKVRIYSPTKRTMPITAATLFAVQGAFSGAFPFSEMLLIKIPPIAPADLTPPAHGPLPELSESRISSQRQGCPPGRPGTRILTGPDRTCR